MVDEDDRLVTGACNEIRDYLARNPHSADSVDGVAAFWVGAAIQSRTREIVQRALEALTARGEVIQDVLPDGRILYRARSGQGEG